MTLSKQHAQRWHCDRHIMQSIWFIAQFVICLPILICYLNVFFQQYLNVYIKFIILWYDKYLLLLLFCAGAKVQHMLLFWKYIWQLCLCFILDIFTLSRNVSFNALAISILNVTFCNSFVQFWFGINCIILLQCKVLQNVFFYYYLG